MYHYQDECEGRPIIEFVGLRSKSYSLLVAAEVFQDTLGDEEPAAKQRKVERKIAAAGVKRRVAEQQLNHENYRKALFQGKTVSVQQNTIRAYDHKLYTITQKKIGLSPVDDKRFILNDTITTRAHGHYLNDLDSTEHNLDMLYTFMHENDIS